MLQGPIAVCRCLGLDLQAVLELQQALCPLDLSEDDRARLCCQRVLDLLLQQLRQPTVDRTHKVAASVRAAVQGDERLM